MIYDTIAQISTALGEGAISIIRVSGDDALNIVNKIFSKDILKAKTHTIHYGYIKEKQKVIDEVLVSVFLAPKTFTTENIVEINCHGGIFVTNKILELVVLNGARLAERGEFTKRAYLNGRIDLTQAESVMDIIDADTPNALDLATKSLQGSVTKLILALKEPLINIIGILEVNIDYPEYDDVEVLTNKTIIPKIDNLIEKMQDILAKSNQGKIIKDGIKTAIIGKPNVGKSSLLNALLNEDKAIVTDIEGTTRDLVEGKINVKGLILNLVDTAGIRKTKNVVEKLGVKRSLEQIEQADLILLVLDNSLELTDTDKLLLEKTKNKKRIVIINKTDISKKLELQGIEDYVLVSAKNNEGLEELKNKILEVSGITNYDSNRTYLSNMRHITNIKKALLALESAKEAAHNSIPLDLVLIDLKEAYDLLDEILGNSKADLLDELFSRFCLGK